MHESSRLSVKDAAAHVGRSKATIYRRIQSGLLQAVADGPSYLVDRVDLERVFEPLAVAPSGDPAELTADLSDPVREWVLEQVKAAPPMDAREARVVARLIVQAGVAA